MRAATASRPVVMVVDDDTSIHAALGLVLEDDFEVLSALTGEAALHCLSAQRVDVILLDLLMPGVDGWQVFEQIRQLRGHQPRVVFLTGVDSSEAAVAAMKLGAHDWILKPFEDVALLTRLRAFCSRSRWIRVLGGDLGARATIATLSFTRCGAFAFYDAEGPAASGAEIDLVEASGAMTLDGLRAAVGQPPMNLTGLHQITTRALHHISRQYRDMKVTILADMIGVHTSYILQLFRNDLALTPREYIARVRIEVLKQRLRQVNCPSLDQLAEDVGLCDAAHVHKIFARYGQGSPSGYRADGQGAP